MWSLSKRLWFGLSIELSIGWMLDLGGDMGAWTEVDFGDGFVEDFSLKSG